jgi:septal ring-binding cell division protein DamX
VYANTADAQAAIERLPLSLQRYRPWIRRISDVQASMDARPGAERR